VELVELESAVVDQKVGRPGAWLRVCGTQLSGTVKSILTMGEHQWDRSGAVYASDVCHFHDNRRGLLIAMLLG